MRYGREEQVNNEECLLYGDVNGDNLINVQDIVLCVNLVMNFEYNINADLNSDNIINVLGFDNCSYQS